MRHLEFDQHLVRIIKIIRDLRTLKQLPIAVDLFTDVSTYSRIEKGLIAITPGQLEIIANSLMVTSDELIALTRISMEIKNKPALSMGDVKISALFPKRDCSKYLQESELLLIINRLGLATSSPQQGFKSLDLSNEILV